MKLKENQTPTLPQEQQVQEQPQPLSLPLDGFSRAKQLLPFLPIGESTLWKWCKEGRFVQPIKLSPTITVWANKDVHAWFNEQRQKGQASNDDTK